VISDTANYPIIDMFLLFNLILTHMSSIFSHYASAQPTREHVDLPVGDSVVRIIEAKELDSFTQWNGARKPLLPSYADACPQYGFLMVAVSGKGSMVHRVNGARYVRFADLSDADKASGRFADEGGYACKLVGDKLIRVQVAPDGEDADGFPIDTVLAGFVNDICHALGKTGMPLSSAIDEAIAEKTPFVVTVANKPFNGKPQLVASHFKPFKLAVASTASVSDIDA
jgi:hypothetical protein